MNKRGLVNWSIWIGVVSGIYVAIYLLTIGAFTSANVLPGWHIVYATFTALPIYFTAGAKREDFVKYIGSYLCGVLWGIVYLWIMDRVALTGIPGWFNTAVMVCLICIVECAIHFCLPSQFPFNVVPAQFGALSNSFWCSNMTISILGPGKTALAGGYNFTAFPILAITLCGGTLLALVCNEGLNFIDADTGSWKWPGKNK